MIFKMFKFLYPIYPSNIGEYVALPIESTLHNDLKQQRQPEQTLNSIKNEPQVKA